MSSKDIMMESIADLMWTEETEEDPNGAVEAPLLVNCGGGGPSHQGITVISGLLCKY